MNAFYHFRVTKSVPPRTLGLDAEHTPLVANNMQVKQLMVQDDMLSGTGLNVWSVFYKRSLSKPPHLWNVYSPFFRD